MLAVFEWGVDTPVNPSICTLLLDLQVVPQFWEAKSQQPLFRPNTCNLRGLVLLAWKNGRLIYSQLSTTGLDTTGHRCRWDTAVVAAANNVPFLPFISLEYPLWTPLMLFFSLVCSACPVELTPPPARRDPRGVACQNLLAPFCTSERTHLPKVCV